MKIKTNKNLSYKEAKQLVIDMMKREEIRKPEGKRQRTIYVDGKKYGDIFVVEFMPIGFKVRKATEKESFDYHHKV